MVILDEAHWVKSQRSSRFSMLKWLLERTSRIVLMSGTLMDGSLLDLWSQFYLLDRGERLMPHYTKFRSFYFRMVGKTGYKWMPYPWAKLAIIEKIAGITYQIPSSQVDKTDLFEDVIYIDYPPEVMAKYRQFERDFLLEYEEDTIVAFNAASLTSKLRQFANGFLYTEVWNTRGHRERARFHDLKYQKLKELADQENEHTIIVATFREDFAVLEEMFPGIPCINGQTPSARTREIIKGWNAGRHRLIAIHPRSVGTGINMQYGGSRQIWISPDWSFLAKKQTIGRILRPGQKDDVRVSFIVARGTIDEIVLRAVKSKGVTSADFERNDAT
jgi:SNF2 family DNA or RNA helicase